MRFNIGLPKTELKKITNNAIAMRLGVLNGLKKGMLFLEGEAKRKFVGRPVKEGAGAPLKVRTGHLRRNIKSKVSESGDKFIGTIGNDVIYAAAIEYGYSPRNLPARPFIRPVLEDKDNLLKVDRMIIREIAKQRNKLRRK